MGEKTLDELAEQLSEQQQAGEGRVERLVWDPLLLEFRRLTPEEIEEYEEALKYGKLKIADSNPIGMF